MAGLLDQFRNKILSTVYKENTQDSQSNQINDRIALGVLLRVVAEADEKFLPEEKQKIEEILKDYGRISTEEIPLIMETVKQAAAERIDLYRFTHEISDGLRYPVKISILENLFRIACADNDLDNSELEMIRKISGLLGVDHKDFISAKISIKKEFGLETV